MKNTEKATLGGGCFWCLEAIYQRINGVSEIMSGYSGGYTDNPTAEQVYVDNTGHAEVVQFTYSPKIISYKELLEVFFIMHDPTTLNRQGNDIGDEYRSIIFYHNEKQKLTAEKMINEFATNIWDKPIVTKLEEYKKFWPAGEEHQNFYNSNPRAGYCQFIINPKVQKLRKEFANKLKTE